MFAQGLNQPLLANFCNWNFNASPLCGGKQRLFQRGQTSLFVLVDQRKLPTLHLLQIIHDLRAGPLLRADELADDLARAIDHEGFRKPRRAIQSVGFLPSVPDREQVDVVVAYELFVRVVVVVLADVDDGHLVAKLLLQLHQRGHLLNARRAPGCPEIEHHGLALKLIQRNRALRIGDGELGCVAADARRMRTVVAGCEEYQASKDSGGDDALHSSMIIHGGCDGRTQDFRVLGAVWYSLSAWTSAKPLPRYRSSFRRETKKPAWLTACDRWLARLGLPTRSSWWTTTRPTARAPSPKAFR